MGRQETQGGIYVTSPVEKENESGLWKVSGAPHALSPNVKFTPMCYYCDMEVVSFRIEVIYIFNV